eukprot:6386280-Amphidinium_carterae.2
MRPTQSGTTLHGVPAPCVNNHKDPPRQQGLDIFLARSCEHRKESWQTAEAAAMTTFEACCVASTLPDFHVQKVRHGIVPCKLGKHSQPPADLIGAQPQTELL